MVIFYCTILVLILFMFFLEFNKQPTEKEEYTTFVNKIDGHLFLLEVMFMTICFLLYNQLYK